MEKINQLLETVKQAEASAAELIKDQELVNRCPHLIGARVRLAAALDSLGLVQADAAKPTPVAPTAPAAKK